MLLVSKIASKDSVLTLKISFDLLLADVAFKIGGDSGINFLVLQVHYLNAMNSPDQHGFTLEAINQP